MRFSEIRRDDLGIAGNLAGPTVGYQPPLMQHRDTVRNSQYAVNIMLDQENGAAFRKAQDQIRDDATIMLGQPRKRLVEQQYLGVSGQRYCDFKQALFAMGKVRPDLPARRPTAMTTSDR
jgi:hypothetical protein